MDFNNTSPFTNNNSIPNQPQWTSFDPNVIQNPLNQQNWIDNPNSTLNTPQNQSSQQPLNFNASPLNLNNMYQQPPINPQYNSNQPNPTFQPNQYSYQQQYPNTSSGGYPPNQPQIQFRQVQTNQTLTSNNNDFHDYDDDNFEELPKYPQNNSKQPYNPSLYQTNELQQKIIGIQNGAEKVLGKIQVIKIMKVLEKAIKFFTEPQSWTPNWFGNIYVICIGSGNNSNSYRPTQFSSYNQVQQNKKDEESKSRMLGVVAAIVCVVLAVVVFISFAGDVEGLKRLEKWETKFHDKEHKLPDEGIEKYKLNDMIQDTEVKLKLALEGPRLAFKAAKDEIMKRMAFKTVSISGLILGGIGFAVVSEGLAVLGILLAAGGGIAWIANKVFRPTYMDIMETKMKQLKSDAGYALELPMFKTQNSY